MYDGGRLSKPVGKGDHVQGPAQAPVTLVEYGDYECPYCGDAYYAVKRVQQDMGDRMRFCFRNFPLVQSHPFAEIAAEAAEAAGAQGKFWQMHDTLYLHQQALRPQDLIGYAQQLGLDVDEFQQALATHRYHDKIEEDYQSGLDSGVQGTPTFFINGQMWTGSFEFESLLQGVEQALRAGVS